MQGLQKNKFECCIKFFNKAKKKTSRDIITGSYAEREYLFPKNSGINIRINIIL